MLDIKIDKSIGLIGAGNMATAIVKGILREGLMDSERINVYDVNPVKLSKLAEETAINICESNGEVVENSYIIILAVKPDVYPLVLDEIKKKLNEKHILISIAAGVPLKYIRDRIEERCSVVRVMPNTPSLIGEGLIAMCKEHRLQEREKNMVLKILSSLGKVEEVEERYINAVTGISGSSPAYVYMFIEALADGGVMMGLPRDQAYRIAAQAVLGSAKTVLESKEHPGVLKDMVCSPGGTTIEAVYALEQKCFRGTVMEAVKKCAEKEKAMYMKGE